MTVVEGTLVNTDSCASFKLFVLTVPLVPAQSVDTSQPLPAVFPPVEETTLVNLSDVPNGTLGELSQICVRNVYETILNHLMATLDGLMAATAMQSIIICSHTACHNVMCIAALFIVK